MSSTDTLPYTCSDHPKAQIRHEWDRSHYVMNGHPAGTGIEGNHHYYCNECGLELAPPKEQDDE